LTHIGSRLSIAAGTLPNNKGDLAGWVVDAQHIKPGSMMPPIHLDGSDLQALLAYLQSLT
jgi:cytochrome c oxidase subunit 2